MNSYLNRLGGIDENDEDEFLEEKLISKAEKRFDDLSKLFTVLESDQCDLTLISLTSQINQDSNILKWEYLQLRQLLLERAKLKIEKFYNDSLKSTRELLKECKSILKDQHLLIENYRLGYSENFKSHSTYFDELSSVTATLKMHTTYWIQTKQMIFTNRWYYYNYNRYLQQYMQTLIKFYRQCIEICQMIKMLIRNGVYILCRVPEDEWLKTSLDDYSQDFFSTFDNLNGINRYLGKLRKSINTTDMTSDIDFSAWNLDKLFEVLSAEDGKYLAIRLSKEFGKKLAGIKKKTENLNLIAASANGKAENSNPVEEVDKAGIGAVNSKVDPHPVKNEKPSVEELLNFGRQFLSNYHTYQPRILRPPPLKKRPLIVTQNFSSSTYLCANVPNDTSDYFSSSASSSKTLPDIDRPASENTTLAKIENEHEFRKMTHSSSLPKKMKKQLQHFYTNFFEHRYTTFNLLLDEGAKHKSLHTTPTMSDSNFYDQPVTRMSTAKKSVKWLDDTLKQNKKQMWKKYIETLWDNFLKEWIDILINGQGIFGSIRIFDFEDAKRMSVSVLDALMMVQLPKELSLCDHIVHEVRGQLCKAAFEIDFQECISQCSTQNPLKISDISDSVTLTILTPVGLLFQRLYKIFLGMQNQQTGCALDRAIIWNSLNHIVSGLSQYDLINGFSVVMCYLSLCEESVNMAENIKAFCGILLRVKLQSITMDTMAEIFPTNKYWRWVTASASSNNNDYTETIQDIILCPLVNAAKFLSFEQRLSFLSASLNEIMQSWLGFIKKSKVRFSRIGAAYLRRDFQTVLNYVQGQDFLSSTDKDAISNLPIFAQLFAIMDFLEGKPSDVTQNGSIAAFSKKRHWRNSKVSPKVIEEDSEGEGRMGAVVLKPDLHVWAKHRVRSTFEGCFCFS